MIQPSTLSQFPYDMKSYRRVRCLNDCTLLQIDIDAIGQRPVDNEPYLNSRKSRVAQFSRKTLHVFSDYYIGTYTINRVSVVRYLGVMPDEKLNFSSHIRMLLLSSF